jgi:hypothetical protein
MAQTTRREDTKKTGKDAPAAQPTGGQSLRNLMQRLGLAGQSTASGGANAQRPRSRVWQFLFGMILFVVGSQLAAYVLFFLDAQFRLGLNTVVLVPSNVPLIGGITPFLVLYLAVVILIWVLLYRFNIIPKDPFGAKAAAEARARERAGAAAGTRGSRSERRAATTASAKTHTEPRRATTVGHGDEAGDSAYERVKAAQRARRRRSAKR